MKTDIDVMDWYATSKPGDRLVYYTGSNLALAPSKVRLAGDFLYKQATGFRPTVALTQLRRAARSFDHIAERIS